MWIPRPRSAAKTGRKASGPSSQKRAEGESVTTAAKEYQSNAVARPMLANSGEMSTFVGAFEVTSKLTGQVRQCRFSHMWNAIATRHADTIDTKFFVDGAAIVVGLAHTAFGTFRQRAGRDLTDREASFIAAEYLRERLEEEDERPLYDVFYDDVLRLIDQIGIK